MSCRLLRVFDVRCHGLVAGALIATACMSASRTLPDNRPAVVLRAAERLPVPGAPTGTTAFVGVTVIPMDAERVLPSQTVLVQNGWITVVGLTTQVSVPAGARRIDGRNKFLIPGLSDCHFHMGVITGFDEPDLPPDSTTERNLFRALADGVTTIRNMDYMARVDPYDETDRGNLWRLNGPDALRLRARAAAGEFWSPRIYTAGQWAPGQYTNFDVVNSADGAKRTFSPPNLDSVPMYVAAYQAAGYDFLKIHDETPAVVAAVLAAARRIGLPVVGHVNIPLAEALAGGIRSIEHTMGFWGIHDGDSLRRAAEATRRAGVWNCNMRSDSVTNALHDAGAGLLLGSDFPLFAGVHSELRNLVKGGLTPYEALATGTTNFAVYSQTLAETGTVAAGKRADLVLLDANPLQDIANSQRIAGVMLGGRWITRDKLDQRLLVFPKRWFDWELRRSDLNAHVTEEQRRQLQERVAKFGQLSDSLKGVKPQMPAYARAVQRLTEELAAVRAILLPEQWAVFDPIARTWLRVQTRQGYRVAIPGVVPVP